MILESIRFSAYIVQNVCGGEYVVPIDVDEDDDVFKVQIQHNVLGNDPNTLEMLKPFIFTSEKLCCYMIVEGWFARYTSPEFSTAWMGEYTSEEEARKECEYVFGGWSTEAWDNFKAEWQEV